jgi:hypothetical protein
MRVTRFSPLLVLAVSAMVGCSSSAEDNRTSQTAEALGETGIDEAGLRTPVSFDTFSDDIGDSGESEVRKIFTSEAAYDNYFGHAPPSDVDFYYDWVVFYSAGTQDTGGYDASIEKIELSSTGGTIYVKTRLESPGSNCSVSQSESKPYVLARFSKPYPRPRYVRYTKDDDTIYCSNPTPTCATTLCSAGTHCINTSEGPECVDDPCPGAGHRNTSTGKCECRVVGICALGTSWDNSPLVCGCD